MILRRSRDREYASSNIYSCTSKGQARTSADAYPARASGAELFKDAIPLENLTAQHLTRIPTS